jgi:zinc transport system ATP-binding protein
MRKTDDPLLRLSNVGRFKNGRWLVRGLDLTVSASEIVTLIGPNGSGKSTAVRLAMGIDRPSEGAVWKRPGLRVAHVPQKFPVDWTMPLRVADFMALSHTTTAAKNAKALEQTGAATLGARELRELSGGELQRVLLARAIAQKPELLVLDEPAQGLDFGGEISLYELIAQLRDDLGCGVLLVSHDLHLVMAATDQVICLNGHICCHGTPERVAASAEYRALFGERASAALAIYQHHHDHRHLADGRVEHADGSVTHHCHPGDGHHHASPVGVAVPRFELVSPSPKSTDHAR